MSVKYVQVTIEFDNSDRSSSPSMYIDQPRITVTRQVVWRLQLHNSSIQIAVGGRDRHFVNGQIKKPKEVQRIFNEARLNIDHPQFLVMQGQVTKVVNMKPMEVLDLFQEAVGTNVFDKERRISERTLKEKQDQVKFRSIKFRLAG